MEGGLGDAPDAPHVAHRQRREEFPHVLGRDDEEPVRLRDVARDLGDELARRHACARREGGLGPDGGLDLASDLRGRPEQPDARGHVEEGLVERERLDERREATEDLAELAGYRDVPLHAAAHDHGAGAAGDRGGHRHRGVDAEGARLVGRRGHDPPAPVAPDEHRAPAERGIVPLLDGSVECVHVDVENVASHAPRPLRARSPPRRQCAALAHGLKAARAEHSLASTLGEGGLGWG